MTTQKTYIFDDLTITKTRIETKSGIIKNIDVSRFNGEYWEILSQNDDDHQKAIKMMLNQENEN